MNFIDENISQYFNVLNETNYDILVNELESTNISIKNIICEKNFYKIDYSNNHIILEMFENIKGKYDNLKIKEVFAYIQSYDYCSDYESIDNNNLLIFCFTINKNYYDLNTNDVTTIINKRKGTNICFNDNLIDNFTSNYQISKERFNNNHPTYDFYTEILNINDNHGYLSIKKNISDNYGNCYHHVNNSLIIFSSDLFYKIRSYHFFSNYKSITLFYICEKR